MAQLTEIPVWLIANLSNYSKQQQAVALTWAYRNLPFDLLAEYYSWALWYRPAFNREIQDLVDRIGYRLEVENMRFQNGMGAYVQQAPSNGMSGLGQFGFDATGLLSVGVGETGISPQSVNVGQGGGSGQWSGQDWANLIQGISNAGAAAAGSITSTWKAVDCQTNPCNANCPNANTPACLGPQAPASASGLFSAGGEGAFYNTQPGQSPMPTARGTTIGQRSGEYVWNGSNWIYQPVGKPTAAGTTIGQRSGNYVWNGTAWVYQATTAVATTAAPTTPGTAVGQRYGNYVWSGTAWVYSPLVAATTPTKILGIELNTTNVLIMAILGIGGYYLWTHSK